MTFPRGLDSTTSQPRVSILYFLPLNVVILNPKIHALVVLRHRLMIRQPRQNALVLTPQTRLSIGESGRAAKEALLHWP